MYSRFILPATVAAGVHAVILFGFRPGTPPVGVEEPPVEKTASNLVPFQMPEDPPEPSDTDERRPRGNVSNRPVGEETWVEPREKDMTITVPRVQVHSDKSMVTIEPGISGVPDGTFDGKTWERGTIIRSGDLDRTPRARVQVRPVYPASARSSGRGAEVTVDFVVDEQGRVESVRVVRSTDSEFEAATLQAVAKWRFEPGRKNGVPVRFRMMVPVVFSLNE